MVDQNLSAKDTIAYPRKRLLRVFLFSEIENEASLLDELGGERHRLVSNEYHRLLHGVFNDLAGREVSAGDAGLVAFEDDPFIAFTAAIEILRRIADHSNPDVRAVLVRIGIHRGEAIPTHQGFFGLDLHRAARISAVAHGGQVLVSEETFTPDDPRIRDKFLFKDLGRHRLRDLNEPQHLFQLIVDGVGNDFPPLRSLEAFPTNLPVQQTRFIGREHDVDRIVQLLTQDDPNSTGHLITLIGPGGVGKTRLSLQAAAKCVQAFPDGVYFVGLASLSSPEAVLPAIAQILGVSESVGSTLSVAVTRFLAARRLLLVLDNFEHLLPAKSIISSLLEGSSGLRIIVSSRTRLGVENETKYVVEPLGVPDHQQLPSLDVLLTFDSIALFIERAKAVKPNFTLTDANAISLAEICTRLDGIPLALELAAARIKIFSPLALLRRLEHGLPLLKTGQRDTLARQATLANTIQWSYDLLEPEEQKLLNRLSVFKGGFTREAASVVCRDDNQLTLGDRLDSLTENSLLQIRQTNGSQRLHMLALIGQFAGIRLEEVGEVTRLRNRHLHYFLDFAQRQTGVGHFPKAASRESIENEDSNLRAAIGWALETHDIETAIRLAQECFGFWRFSSSAKESRVIIERMLELADEQTIGTSLFSELLVEAADFYMFVADFQSAQLFLRRLDELPPAEVPFYRQAEAWVAKGYLARMQGNYGEARNSINRAIELATRDRCEYLYPYRAVKAQIDIMEKNYRQAIHALDQLLSIMRRKGDLFFLGMASVLAGQCELELGNSDRALAHCLEALELAQSLYRSGRVADIMLPAVLVMVAVSVADSEPALGAKLLSQQAMFRDERGLAIDAEFAEMADHLLVTLKQRLPEAEFQAAWTTGQKLSLQELTPLVKAKAKVALPYLQLDRF